MNRTVPEVVLEFRYREERWSDAFNRMVRFLGAGVEVVYLFDEVSRQVGVFFADTRPPRTLKPDDEVLLPGQAQGQSGVLVRQFFD